jgi:hypothetical protein
MKRTIQELIWDITGENVQRQLGALIETAKVVRAQGYHRGPIPASLCRATSLRSTSIRYPSPATWSRRGMTSLQGRSMTAVSICAVAVAFVEKGIMSDDYYREFVFSNSARLYASLNSDFFKVTANEKEATKALS